MKIFLRSLATAACLMMAAVMMGQTTVWRNQHKVKKRETVFGIAKEYGITIEQLIDANPEMKKEGYELRKGDLIFVPFAKKDDVKTGDSTIVAAPAQPSAPASQPKAQKQAKALRVGVMLPLHDVNGDGLRMLEYYRGLLLAVEDVKKLGISVDVRAWNVPEDADIRTTLLDKNADKLDIIFGPLYTKMVAPLASFCQTYGIKMVIPFSISGNDVASNSQIFQVYQDDYDVTQHAVNAFLERFGQTGHPVFIDCNDPSSRKGAFTTTLRSQLTSAGVTYNITNLNTDQASFAKAFDPTKTNVVVLNTARSPQLNAVFAKLATLKQEKPQLKIAMYGYTEWLMYKDYDLQNFYRYNVYIPTTYYYNAAATKTKNFEARYKTAFGQPMMQALPRFAITGYDQGMYFLEGLAQYGKEFTGSQKQSTYRPLQTKLWFQRVGNGGYKNNYFLLIHFLDNQTVEAINY